MLQNDQRQSAALTSIALRLFQCETSLAIARLTSDTSAEPFNGSKKRVKTSTASSFSGAEYRKTQSVFRTSHLVPHFNKSRLGE